MNEIKMAKKMYNDRFNAHYSHISSIIYNSPHGKKLAIKPAFHKQQPQSHLNLGNKMTISSIPSIYSKKVDNEDFGFGSKKNQILFVRKVYFAVLLQLALVIGLQCVSKYVEQFKTKCKESGYCNWVPLASTILSLIILACCEFHRRFPYNYIALIYFTCSSSVFLMVTQQKITTIFYATIIFAASIIGLFIFSCQSKIKYTIYTGIGIILICDAISFVSLYAENTENWKTYLYAEILATVFLLFFVIDIQIMISGNHKYEIRDTENVFATMTIYTDIVNLFIYVLQLLNSAKD